jgi:hypothetical protein
LGVTLFDPLQPEKSAGYFVSNHQITTSIFAVKSDTTISSIRVAQTIDSLLNNKEID